MKKIIKPAIIAVILGIIAFWLWYSNSGSTINKELRDFAIEDTASITKIFMVDKNNRNVTLERKNGGWILNNGYGVRKDLVDVLLKTINRLHVKAPVSKSAHNTIVKNLASVSVKVEIYQDSKLRKVYYVGGATPDNLGTYMLLEGSSVPFVMDIPGFSGYLTTRFSTDELDWKDRNVFRYKFSDIAGITVENPAAPSQSFRILCRGNNRFLLRTLTENTDIQNFDTLSVKEYISNFKNLNFETYVAEIPAARLDSIKKSRPLFNITVEDKEGGKKIIRMYLRPNYDKYVDGNNEKTNEFDPDRMYAFINNGRDLVIIQYYVFDPVMKELNYFLTKRKKPETAEN